MTSDSSSTVYTFVEPAKVAAAFADCIDLAVATRGGKILTLTDEWFADCSNLLTATPPVSKPGTFTANGAWYDGWETRRHNPEAFDWCVIQLGYPGSIAGFEVDTAFFTGNHSPFVSVEGYCHGSAEDVNKSQDEWAKVDWDSILPKVALNPSSVHGFKLIQQDPKKFYTHVRFRMYPDGGVARLRVYGKVQQQLPKDLNEIFDLASTAAGSVVQEFSDAHYGSPSNMFLPGRGHDMSDGWETKRSRSPGHVDWCTVKLGAPGHVSLIEVDTAHYMGNPPKAVTIEGFSATAPAVSIPLISNEFLKPHRQHFFALPSEVTEKHQIQSVKITMIPDGGIKRVRLFGSRALPGKLPEGSAIGQRQMLPDELTWNLRKVQPVKMTKENFAKYGQMVQLPEADPNAIQVNQGTAQKFSHLAQFINLRQANSTEVTTGSGLKTAEVNVAIFKCYKPVKDPFFGIRLLERHSYSSQMFMPMGGDGNGSYVVVVAENDEKTQKPILGSLKAFECDNSMGINYRPNVWHHPMIVLKKPTTFMTVTYESGVSVEDCEEYWFTEESGAEGGAAALIKLQ